VKDDVRDATGSVSATNAAYDDSTGVTDTADVTGSLSATDGTDSINVAGPAGSPDAINAVSVAIIIITSLFAVRGSDILFVFLVLLLSGVLAWYEKQAGAWSLCYLSRRTSRCCCRTGGDCSSSCYPDYTGESCFAGNHSTG